LLALHTHNLAISRGCYSHNLPEIMIEYENTIEADNPWYRGYFERWVILQQPLGLNDTALDDIL